MKKGVADVKNVVTDEEAKSYASNMIRGIQNSIFSSMNSNQSIRSDTYSVNFERWCNHSSRPDNMQQDWLISNSSLQTKNAQSFDNSCTQNHLKESLSQGKCLRKIRNLSPPGNIMYRSSEYFHQHFQDSDKDSLATAGSTLSSNLSKDVPQSTPESAVKPGKKCPVCFEINTPKSNWCMECGKAILSVEVRRYDNVGEPCDTILQQTSPNYKSNNLSFWNDSYMPSQLKHRSFDDRYSPENISVMMNNVKLEHMNSSMMGTSRDNYYEEGRSSISFDFENPQFDDLGSSNIQYPKHHAVYRRASHDRTSKEREDFYPFDDLLYPEFAIYDPNLGYTFPSSNIISNNGGYYTQQIPVYMTNKEIQQHSQSSSNKKYNNKKNSQNKKKRNKKHQPKAKVYPKLIKSEETKNNFKTLEESSDISNDELCYWGLPDEVILHIFSFLKMKDLNVCLRVSKNFNRLASDGKLWEHISLKKRHNLTDNILAKIAIKKPVSLSLTQCNGKNITMDGLRFLFQNCANSLKKLDISCSNGGALIGETVMLHAFRCKNIDTLDVSWSNVSSTGVQSMCQAANRLVHLSLNGCQLISDDSVEAIVKKHGESLQTLEVFGCFNISPTSIDLIGKHCKNLLQLNVGQCHKISNQAVSSIAKNMQKMKNLDLRGCKTIRDSSLREISLNCKDLTTLVVANCPCITDATLTNIAVNLPTLESLDACGCGKISDRGVCGLAKGLKNLKMLDVSSTKVTSRSVSMIAYQNKRSIRSLKLSFCHYINDQCLHALVANCKKLHTLHLYGIKPPKNLNKLMDTNPNLKIERESLR